MIVLHGPQGSELYLRVAKQHGEESDPDHEVGDLQTFFRTAWLLMDDKVRSAFVNHPDVRSTLAAALGVDEDDPEEFQAALAEAVIAADPTTPPNL